MPGAAFCLMLTTDYVWKKWYANRLKPYTVEWREPGVLIRRTIRGPAFPHALAPLPKDVVRVLRTKKRVKYKTFLDWPFLNGVANIRLYRDGRYFLLLITGVENTETYYMRCRDWQLVSGCIKSITGKAIGKDVMMVTGNTVFVDLELEGFDKEYLEALNDALVKVGDIAQMSFDKGIGGEVILKLLEAHSALQSIYPLVEAFLKTENNTPA